MEKIGQFTMEEWTELSRRDSACDEIVPSDIRCLLTEIRRLSLPEQLPVLLNLEQSGWLCHLMLASISQEPAESLVLDKETILSLRERQMVLYRKLCTVNDRLMGKT